MRGLGILLILLFFSQRALAAPQCLQIFSTTSDFLRPLSAPPEVPGAMKERMFDVIENVNQWIRYLSGYFKVGAVNIQTGNASYRSSLFVFGPRGPALMIGLDTQGRSEAAHRVVVSHEFGHYLFSENVVFEYKGKTWTLAEAFIEGARSREQLNHNVEFQRLISEIKELNEVLETATLAGKQQLVQDLSEAVARRKQRVLEMDDRPVFVDYVNDVLSVYNELFADSVAVLFNGNNPRAVTDALDVKHDHHLSFLHQQLINRGNNDGANIPASREFAVTGFKNWKHELGNTYTLLDPARGVLWELYMKNIKPEHIPLFLKTFIEATGRHVSDRMATSSMNLRVSAREVDPLELNQSFLRYFRAAANRNGLPISK